MDAQLPVKYVRYSHYMEGDDFKDWKDKKDCSELKQVKYLTAHLPRLIELLSAAAFEGMLVLYYAPGVRDCLHELREGPRGISRGELCRKFDHLKFADEVQTYVGKCLACYTDGRLRVRFITSLDLVEIFDRLNWNFAANLPLWLLGDVDQVRYDAPKIVEAIVRLRLLGTGIPLFRLDWDVLFRGDNSAVPDLGIFRAIASCRQAFLLRRDESSVATFLVSASYDTSAIGREDGCFDAWRGAFATRVFPALPVIQDKIDKVGTMINDVLYDWDSYTAEVFREDLARKFYGMKEKGLNSAGLEGIGYIGAHPLVSIISGALLCLSEGAIVDLPPFSNFGLNVSWIDDHLKYCLHRELRHLTTVELASEPLLSDAKLDTVQVRKARAPISNLPEYVLGTYLPTLFWGTIMDAWITPDPLLKYRPEDGLSVEQQKKWRSLKRKGMSDGTFPHALQEALREQNISDTDKGRLRQRLDATAVVRIHEVREQWKQLRLENGPETFASIWAKGEVLRHFPHLNPTKVPNDHPDRIERITFLTKCLGIAPGLDSAFEHIFSLNNALSQDYGQLKEATVQYIDWTLNWPKLVQVVRSVEPGTVPFDVSWTPQP